MQDPIGISQREMREVMTETQTREWKALIQEEYDRIQSRWLRIHLWVAMGMAALVCGTEVLFFFLLRHMEITKGPASTYLVKYILAPTGLNLLAILAAVVILRRASGLRLRTYAMSLLFVLMCFFTYTAHNVFFSVCMVFALPILLTTAYGDLTLTTVTAAFCLLSKTVSDGLIRWDPSTPEKLSSSQQVVDFLLSLVILAAVYVGCVLMIRVEQAKNAISIRREVEKVQLMREAITDPLTGVWNRQGMERTFELMRQDISDAIYVLVILDLDNFKAINDTYGHQQGDQYLRELGRILAAVPKAKPFRFGGDEFCLLFRGMTVPEVKQACREIRDAYGKSGSNRHLHPLSISFGAAVFQKGFTAAELMGRADEALYQAKQKRGSFCLYEEEKRFSESDGPVGESMAEESLCR